MHLEKFSACVFLSSTKTKNRGLPRRRGDRRRQRSASHCQVRSPSYRRNGLDDELDNNLPEDLAVETDEQDSLPGS